MKRMKWKLTLWWRTLTQGPMCQRCEDRHGDKLADEAWCDFWVRFEANNAEIMRLARERKAWPS